MGAPVHDSAAAPEAARLAFVREGLEAHPYAASADTPLGSL